MAEKKESVEAAVRTIRRVTRKEYSGAAPSAHPSSAGSRLTPGTSGVTAEAEEVCLSWEPRLVPLSLTRYRPLETTAPSLKLLD